MAQADLDSAHCARQYSIDHPHIGTRMSSIPITRQRLRILAPLLLVLLAALALRLLLWGQIPRTGLISDEGEYLSAASWLAQGRNFSWYQDYLWTRAPIYPLFVAVHLRL